MITWISLSSWIESMKFRLYWDSTPSPLIFKPMSLGPNLPQRCVYERMKNEKKKKSRQEASTCREVDQAIILQGWYKH